MFSYILTYATLSDFRGNCFKTVILLFDIYYARIFLRVVQDFFKPSISDEKKRAISLFSILILVFEIPPTALFVDRIDCIMSSLKDENNANETIKVFFVTS